MLDATHFIRRNKLTSQALGQHPFNAKSTLRYSAVMGLVVLLSVLLFMPHVSHAQSSVQQSLEMTVEELEALLAANRESLEQDMRNREKTREKAEKIKQDLAMREAKAAELKAEIETLCREQDVIKPGSYEICLENFEN